MVPQFPPPPLVSPAAIFLPTLYAQNEIIRRWWYSDCYSKSAYILIHHMAMEAVRGNEPSSSDSGGCRHHKRRFSSGFIRICAFQWRCCHDDGQTDEIETSKRPARQERVGEPSATDAEKESCLSRRCSFSVSYIAAQFARLVVVVSSLLAGRVFQMTSKEKRRPRGRFPFPSSCLRRSC